MSVSDKVLQGDAQVPVLAEETTMPARGELQKAGLSAEKPTGADNHEKAVSLRFVSQFVYGS